MTVKIDGTNTVANPAFTGADTDTGLQCGTNQVKLVTGGTSRATIDSSGNVSIDTNLLLMQNAKRIQWGGSDVAYVQGQDGASSGHIIFGANGEKARILASGGVTFNGDTAAANALDDYEEGTFTPTLTGASTYNTQSGSYRKIGNLVHFSIFVGVSATPSSTNMEVNGLPFASRSGNAGYAAPGRCWTNSWASNGNNIQWLISPNSTKLVAYSIPSSGGVGTINSNNMGSNGNFIITGAYHTP